jgi:hypothetical protein
MEQPEPASPPGDPGPPALRWALGSASLLLAAWRLWTVPVGQLWRDWGLIVAFLALLSSAAPRRPFRTVVLCAAMAFLLGIYVQGQWPHLLALFTGGPG